MNSKKEHNNKKIQGEELTTFPVPIDLEVKENISVSSNISIESSKDKIINQAIKLHLQGSFMEAKKYYQYCIKKGINDYRVFSNYGAILKDIGKLKEAEISTRKAIELQPFFAEAYSNLGGILNDLGKLKEAEISTRKAIKLNPNFADAHFNLGNILKDLGQLDEAERLIKKAIELQFDFRLAHKNLGIINLIKTINSCTFDTSKRLLLELSNDYPESINEIINEFFKYWYLFCKRLVDECNTKKLISIFIDLIIIGERNDYVNKLNNYIFDNLTLKSLLNFACIKDKILITLGYCEYKFRKEDFGEAEILTTQNIITSELLIKKKETEDLGWVVVRRSLLLFKNKNLGRKNLLNLIDKLPN